MKTEPQNQLDTSIVDTRCIWTDLEIMGYSEKQIRELLLFMEKLPIHKFSTEAQQVEIKICKGHIVVI